MGNRTNDCRTCDSYDPRYCEYSRKNVKCECSCHDKQSLFLQIKEKDDDWRNDLDRSEIKRSPLKF